MADSKRYKDWFDKAESDLKGAEILLRHEGVNDLVAFHCQQAIEKSLKGWILKNTGELSEVHSLVHLCKTAIREGAKLRPYLKDCAFVNQFYIETRYPVDIPMDVTDDEARECVTVAKEIMNICRAE